MKVLVIGSGGREHAICWKLYRQSQEQNREIEIFCAPGNVGISSFAKCVSAEDLKECAGAGYFEQLADFAKKNNITFTFVGPEVPLAEGIVDCFENEDLKIIGPSKEAAKLESSKIYSKEFMKKYGIPTAEFHKFSDINEALKFLESWEENNKVVVKADGLAAGKGVYMCNGRADAVNAVKEMMANNAMGEAGSSIVIEEFIDGQELSYLVFTDGIDCVMMPAAQDHKRRDDGDKGLNTGGMGAYCPAPLTNKKIDGKALKEIVRETIVEKTLDGIKSEKLEHESKGLKYEYKGIIYVGIIMDGNDKPYVLEYNCRFGDPETQAVLPLLKTNLADICLKILDGKLKDIKDEIDWEEDKAAVCVVLASGDYPGKCEKSYKIRGLKEFYEKNNPFNSDTDTFIFHSGTTSLKWDEDNKKIRSFEIPNSFMRGIEESTPLCYFTSGGRVLAVTSVAKDIQSARDKVYSLVGKGKMIEFEGMHYREDIAKKAVNN
ncbi:MAG: phosphoribosylamine--glycine ligase [Endomicrobia bacterium]|nr:phosphoribosylamine--glycine ligase [Endomicrobiia bacterium]